MQLIVFQVFKHVGPDLVSFAQNKDIGMRSAVVGKHGDMRPAERDMEPFFTEHVRKGECLGGSSCLHADGDEVPRFVKREFLKAQIADLLVDAFNVY